MDLVYLDKYEAIADHWQVEFSINSRRENLSRAFEMLSSEEPYAERNFCLLEKMRKFWNKLSWIGQNGTFCVFKLSELYFLIKFCNISNVPRLFNNSSESSIPKLVGSIA